MIHGAKVLDADNNQDSQAADQMALVPVAHPSTVAVKAQADDSNAAPSALITLPVGFETVVSHDNVKRAAAVAAVFGAQLGAGIGHVMAPKMASQVSKQVEATVQRVGEEAVQTTLDNMGIFGKVPGVGALMRAEVAAQAHQAGVQAYDQTIQTVTTRSAALASTAAAVSTVIGLEAANGVVYLIGEHVKPAIVSHFEQRRALASQRLINQQITDKQVQSEFVEQVIGEDDENDADLKGFTVLVKNK